MVAPTPVWVALPTLFYRGLAAALMPAAPRPGWYSRLAAAVGTRAERRRADRPNGPRGKPQQTPSTDPFVVLELQTRLGVLAGQLHTLEADERIYARARRTKATEAAYDHLLAEACRLAGVVDPTADRFTRELELASRGWSW